MEGYNSKHKFTSTPKMSDVRQDILFNGSGMDTDSDVHFIANGDGRERRNILVGGG